MFIKSVCVNEKSKSDFPEQNRSDNDYIKNNYDQVRFTVKKGKKEELKEHCSKFGYKSVNDFINQAVNEKIARDLDEM